MEVIIKLNKPRVKNFQVFYINNLFFKFLKKSRENFHHHHHNKVLTLNCDGFIINFLKVMLRLFENYLNIKNLSMINESLLY